MTFEEILDQATAMLQRRGRVSYRTLTLQFHLNEESLEALKEELIEVHHLAVDHEGRMLVWAGETRTDLPVPPSPQSLQQATRQEDQPSQVAAPAAPQFPDAERRQLTVTVLRSGGLHSPGGPARPRRPARGRAGLPGRPAPR